MYMRWDLKMKSISFSNEFLKIKALKYNFFLITTRYNILFFTKFHTIKKCEII